VQPRDVRVYGANSIGLERRGFSEERIRKIQHAFRILVNSKLNTTQALERLKSEGDQGEDVAMMVRFVEQSERGVIK
jgi:UDP-N-acetylglucosamine acyltransferase